MVPSSGVSRGGKQKAESGGKGERWRGSPSRQLANQDGHRQIELYYRYRTLYVPDTSRMMRSVSGPGRAVRGNSLRGDGAVTVDSQLEVFQQGIGGLVNYL